MMGDKMIKPIGICTNEKLFNHSGNWGKRWLQYCVDHAIPYEMVDPYRPDIVQRLGKYSALLWAIQNYVHADLIESRNILRVAERMGLPVFPDHNTAWHFDDKIAEMYLLQSIGAPIPESRVFYLLDDCVEWLMTEAEYPLIAKLRNGSGSNNVKMLKTRDAAIRYAKRMFTRGFHPAPGFLYKAYSKAQSSREWKTALARIRKIPEFLHTLSRAKRLAREHDYCYFQQFVENDGYDLKVAVVGDKLGYLVRKTRCHDFRASGGGDLFFNRALVTDQIRDSAFSAAEAAGLQCIGFDYVVDRRTGAGVIIEMCYGFDWTAIEQAGGYWDPRGVWHDEPLRVPDEIIANLLQHIDTDTTNTIVM